MNAKVRHIDYELANKVQRALEEITVVREAIELLPYRTAVEAMNSLDIIADALKAAQKRNPTP